MDRGASEDVPVLIVGGSLDGLSAALELLRAEANCAGRFGDGRVFLAGDAAHVWWGEPGRPTRRAASPGAYGISPSGAVMVRPDGFVGWRAPQAVGAPERGLRQALQTLLCRGDGRP